MQRPLKLRVMFVIALGLMLALAATFASLTARAQSAQVAMVNTGATTYAFQPTTITVSQGSTVTWTNQSTALHTVTSDTGAWTSADVAPNASTTVTFNQAGTFPYHCMIHPYMTGQVVVLSASTATATGSASATASTSATATSTSIPLSASLAPTKQRAGTGMGPTRMTSQMTFQGYYDGHLDSYLSTDISNKSQSTSMHINFSAALAHTTAWSDPMYLVQGKAAAHQLAVFGSEPGEADYSPLWHELAVTWKAGAHRVLLTSDNQILALQKRHKLTLRKTNVILNCPITKVGKKT